MSRTFKKEGEKDPFIIKKLHSYSKNIQILNILFIVAINNAINNAIYIYMINMGND